jgi:hypothetical protein
MSDMRRVRNIGEEPLVDAFDGAHYWIEPGKDAVVPLEAVDLWFGDNTFVDEMHRRYRNDEYLRLRIRYGANDDEALWEQNKPKVQVLTLDGDELETVLSDPGGDKVTPTETTVDEKRELWQLIEQQQRELNALKRDFQKKTRQDEAVAEGDLEEDEPQTVPSRRARSK